MEADSRPLTDLHHSILLPPHLHFIRSRANVQLGCIDVRKQDVQLAVIIKKHFLLPNTVACTILMQERFVVSY